MGRAMLIICVGVLVSLGYMGISMSQRGRSLTEKNAVYAEYVHAKNAAHTAIQIAMNKINDDNTWAGNHHAGSAWTPTIDGAGIALYVDEIYKSPNFWQPDTLRIVSKATYMDQNDIKVVSVYLKNPYDKYVSNFKSPLTIATQNYNFTAGGSSSISGTDYSGKCTEKQLSSTPAVTVAGDNLAQKSTVESELSGISTEGSSAVVSDPDLTYNPTDQLVKRLAQTEGVQYLSGNYKGSMGTKESPGVFFVEEATKLTGGISEGYGILVIRSDGGMSYDSLGTEVDIAGNFTFNGLVIFENAYNFKGRGTPTINGSVLVGNTDDYSGSGININISGNLALQYDCMGEQYAKMAANLAIKQDKYTRLVTYE